MRKFWKICQNCTNCDKNWYKTVKKLLKSVTVLQFLQNLRNVMKVIRNVAKICWNIFFNLQIHSFNIHENLTVILPIWTIFTKFITIFVRFRFILIIFLSTFFNNWLKYSCILNDFIEISSNFLTFWVTYMNDFSLFFHAIFQVIFVQIIEWFCILTDFYEVFSNFFWHFVQFQWFWHGHVLWLRVILTILSFFGPFFVYIFLVPPFFHLFNILCDFWKHTFSYPNEFLDL